MGPISRGYLGGNERICRGLREGERGVNGNRTIFVVYVCEQGDTYAAAIADCFNRVLHTYNTSCVGKGV